MFSNTKTSLFLHEEFLKIMSLKNLILSLARRYISFVVENDRFLMSSKDRLEFSTVLYTKSFVHQLSLLS